MLTTPIARKLSETTRVISQYSGRLEMWLCDRVLAYYALSYVPSIAKKRKNKTKQTPKRFRSQLEEASTDQRCKMKATAGVHAELEKKRT